MTKQGGPQEKRKQELLERIADNLGRRLPADLRKAAQVFAKTYYAAVPLEDLMETSLEALSDSIYELWTFSFTRLPKQIKIRAYADKKEIKGNLTSHIIVEIVNDDMPFLVDSVIGAINSLGYSIHLVIHPVMRIERDKHHSLTGVFQRNEQSKGGGDESFIHCEILEPSSPKKLKALEEAVGRSLHDARAAVEDWEPMRKQLRAAIKDLKSLPINVSKESLQETLDFLEWIEDNHFTFLGFCEYSLIPHQKTIQKTLIPQEGRGILRDPLKQEITRIFEGTTLTAANRQYILDPDPCLLTKTTQISLVHRRDPMDSILIKQFDKEGNVIGLKQFVGLFTSVAYNRSARDIPLLRRKVSRVLERSGFAEQWHDGKTLIHILESFPRDELFQASEDWLFETCMAVLHLQNRQRLTLFVRVDKFERFVSCLVYVPRERYDSELRQKIAEILERGLKGRVTNWQVHLGDLAFARVHFTIKLPHKEILSYDLKALEEELIESSLTWRDHLHHALFKAFGEEKGQVLFERYGKGFTKGYQERSTADEAIIDIHEIEEAFVNCSRLRTLLTQRKDQDKSNLRFKIYSPENPVPLSNVLPVLEHMNLKVISEIPFSVTLSDQQKIWIHDFDMRTQEGDPVELENIYAHFLEAFDKIWCEEVENDGFNRLIVRANFEWRECQLIRAYAKYISQLHGTFSQHYMEEVLAKYPHICRLILHLFVCQFSPDSKEDRERAREEILNRIKAFLEDVSTLDEDRILSKFVNAVASTLRTNYYQLEEERPKPYVSFKIDSGAIDEMPLPRPKYEVFVYAPWVEAIHLRGGPVARGGIRWSDRRADFRTEILGLMKAQMAKNAVIVPVGSKGGFVIKRPSKQELGPDVVFCYKTMIRGLLDLTDNIKEQEIIPPPDCVRWDGDDPYLVVAADKGTASFSDFANQVAAEYDFWLGDAFASGGSTGYDHKKMGITARGAWESAKRHFREINIDITQEEITVAGIGDMSGDVFGNGMLLSPHLKLVAAFNHMHIFIDPSPDPKKSFKERKRLFTKPHSTWADYNPKIISPGGGVFERQAKSILISPEMKALFGIEEDFLTPPELIVYTLKAPVDLLWLGGIGTFIKARNESNLDVGDRVNDSLRINGIEVGAKVVVEGANLGVTQQGRIEYAKNGGLINTDAIDNSAGVDCSDHEVNIKIPLHQAVAHGKLTLEARNILLKEMEDDVATLVLRDNFWQNQVISLARSQGVRLLDEQSRLIRDLEREGFLNRTLEALPDETEIARRMADKQGLTRPELAILLAYSKLSLKNSLIHSELPDLDIFQSRLLSYFPERLHQDYQEELATHPLRREIIVTLFTNSIVNRMGLTFVHEMKRQCGVEGADVAKSYFIVRELLDLVTLWRNLEVMETLPVMFQTQLMLNIYENVKQVTDWFLKFNLNHQSIEETVLFFKQDFEFLRENLPAFFTPQQQQTYEENYRKYTHLGIAPSLSQRLITLDSLVSAPDIITLGKELKIDIKTVARVYFALDQQLGFSWLRKMAFDLSGETHWQQEASYALIEDFYGHQKMIAKQLLIKGEGHLWMEDGTLVRDLLPTSVVESILSDLMNASTVDFAMMAVINRRLGVLALGG